MVQLDFGYTAGVPADYRGAVWGARLIYPADLVWDRQDNDYTGDGDREAALKQLHEWLNRGALNAALKACHRFRSDEQRHAVLHEDERGIIVGNPNASYGYVYVAAWLKDPA